MITRTAPWLITCALLLVATFGICAADDPIAACIKDATSVRGVVVVAADTSSESLAQFAKRTPAVILAVVSDDKRADSLRDDLRKAGVYGQVTVQTPTTDGRIALADGTASLVIADLSSLDQAHWQRVLRPQGELHQLKDGKWQSTTKPRPGGAGDWTHYNGDAANSQHSTDTLLGPPRGMQWLAGPTNQLDYVLIDGHVMIGETRTLDETIKDQRLIARDAFSGLPLWERNDSANNRFSLILEDGKLYYHAQINNHQLADHTVVLDASSGELLQEYDEGLNFHVTKEEAKADRNAYKRQQGRAADMQLRLVDGVLLQVIREEVVALDAETGKRLWARKAGDELGFASPTVGDNTLYLVQGDYVRWTAYTHWPMARPHQILALDLHTGEEKWRLDWDEERFMKPHAVYSLQYEDGLLAAAVTGYIPELKKDASRPRGFGLILNADDGSVVYFGREEGAWPGTTGHGHSHVRLHLRDKTAWTLQLGGPLAAWSIDDPRNYRAINKLWNDRGVGMRPVSCTVWRSNGDYWIGGLGLYPMRADDGEPYFNRSGRSNCDIGAFPANGMLYSPPNTCQCQPYLPGSKAYHSRTLNELIPDSQRLTRGHSKPAAQVKDEGKAWPQWAQSPARRWWSHQAMPTDLRQVWQIKVTDPLPQELLASQWQTDAVLRGPITQVTVAEGVLVYAECHAQTVVALDPDSGKEKWRTPVEGRVDMSPTIHHGLVLAGTRNGYVYALNRDTGELVWRFTAAPQEDRIVVNGQLESPWPVFGAVPVDERGVLAIAGRHTSNDGGLFWWRLDPATGNVLDQGRINDGKGSRRAANWLDKLPIEQRPIQNSVAVMSDKFVQLVGQPLKRTELGLGQPGEDGNAGENTFASWEDFAAVQQQEKIIRSGRNAIIGERQQTVGGWRKPAYANTLARMFAIDEKSDRFISIGGGRGTAHGRGGGGDSKVHLLQMLDKPEKVGPFVHLSEQIWENDDPMLRSRNNPAITAIAVSDNAVFLGLSIVGPESDRIYREGRAEMPHRLRILDLESGKLIRDLPLPATPHLGGIALADGRVYVATMDGQIVAFAEK